MGGCSRVSGLFWDPPSRIFLRHFLELLNIYPESSAQELSIGTLFEGIGYKGGSVDMSTTQEARALRCRPRGELSQRSSNSLKTSRIVPA